MNPLDLVKLRSLMNITEGNEEISIGVIDGPVDFNHIALKGSKIKTINDAQFNRCINSDDIACNHGTFIVGMLAGKRKTLAPAICPGCQIILRPIFTNSLKFKNNMNYANYPISTPKELANAIVETINAGAKIINLSLGVSSSPLVTYHELQDAYEYAIRKNVIIIAAAGNDERLGYAFSLNHQWIIPVAACNESGKISDISNLGASIFKRGVMAPGTKILSTSPGNKFVYSSGTSFAAPFVSGTLALLWSIFPNAICTNLINSINSIRFNSRARSIIPELLDAELAYRKLKEVHN